VLLSLPTALLVLLYALVAILVVDLALFFVADNFVGFGNLYELLTCCLVPTSSC